jgi:hypothetical protein
MVRNGTYFQCPGGSYCPEATQRPWDCPAGTYSQRGQAPTFMSDCDNCPEHFYCPLATNDAYEYICDQEGNGGVYCPLGASDPRLCEEGYWCRPSATGEKTSYGFVDTTGNKALRQNYEIIRTLCPENFYCPLGTPEPIACDDSLGQICPEGSIAPTYNSADRNKCAPGFYFGVLGCEPCMPGFLCKSGTNTKYPVDVDTEGGYECPVGHYCPGGTSEENVQACPAGRFRVLTRGKALEDCGLCPDGSYSDQEASESCSTCGRASTHNADRTSCECVGAYRVWQPSDSACICKKGYREPTDPPNDIVAEEMDCEIIVKSVCPDGEHMDETQNCVSDSICADSCSGSQSSWNSEKQRCICKGVSSDADDSCDSDCRDAALKAVYVSATEESEAEICLYVKKDD